MPLKLQHSGFPLTLKDVTDWEEAGKLKSQQKEGGALPTSLTHLELTALPSNLCLASSFTFPVQHQGPDLHRDATLLNEAAAHQHESCPAQCCEGSVSILELIAGEERGQRDSGSRDLKLGKA